MSSLFASLNSASYAIRVLQNAIGTTQNNITNASTPGYAKQRLQLEAERFDLRAGYTGGVQDGGLVDSRSRLAEQAVRTQREALGSATAQASSLSMIESEFDISGDSGILASLNQLFDSFSDWSSKPEDGAARQAVLSSAESLAQSFQTTAGNLEAIGRNLTVDIGQTIEQINTLGAKIQALNVQKQTSQSEDAGLDAQTYAALEELSKLVNFSTLYHEDGTVSVLLGGQYPLVLGATCKPLSCDAGAGAGTDEFSTAVVRDSSGNDITAALDGGSLGGMLAVRNGDLAGLLAGDGGLNRLARAFADRVNGILESAGGEPLFTYDTSGAASVASSLRVNSDLAAADLVAEDAGPPAVSNGVCLKLAGLADSSAGEDQIDGLTYVEFYSSIASGVGRRLSEAEQSEELHTDLAAQAAALRDGISGVSLDEEAVNILELQRAYQANARVVSVVSDLTEELLNLVG